MPFLCNTIPHSKTFYTVLLIEAPNYDSTKLPAIITDTDYKEPFITSDLSHAEAYQAICEKYFPDCKYVIAEIKPFIA